MCRITDKVGDGIMNKTTIEWCDVTYEPAAKRAILMNQQQSEQFCALLISGEQELAIINQREEAQTPKKTDELDAEVRGIRESDCVFDGKFEWWPMKKRPDVNIGDHVRIYFVKVSHD